MGMQGPLTAQALGRSPYDEVVEGEGDDDGHEPAQQYDSRGRPINPETKRINREIVRAHNEVMLVIGVAEPENLNAGPEAESQRRHESYEEAIGLALGSVSKRCVEAVGIFGVHGFRQRILVRLPSVISLPSVLTLADIQTLLRDTLFWPVPASKAKLLLFKGHLGWSPCELAHQLCRAICESTLAWPAR